MSDPRTIAMLGLPRTGKSTFLGALWLLIQDATVEDLTEEDFTGDRHYLNALARQVAEGDEIERTSVGSEEGLSLTIGFGESGTAQVEVPDLSGETVTGLVERGEWRLTLANAVMQASAIMVFVHPDKVDFPVPAALRGQTLGAGEDVAEDELRQFSVDDACTAAKLIALLENVIELPDAPWPIPIAVVVSAWDRAGSPSPAAWLRHRLPGFSAMLETNPDAIRHTVFGVSAQGGRLPQQKAELLKKAVVDRAYAVDASGERVPLFAPLHWAVWS